MEYSYLCCRIWKPAQKVDKSDSDSDGVVEITDWWYKKGKERESGEDETMAGRMMVAVEGELL